MLCTPIGVFSTDFDRAMRVADEVWPEPERAPQPVDDGTKSPQDRYPDWGRHHFAEVDKELLRSDEEMLATINDLDADMNEQLAEDPDAIVDYDALGSWDQELADPEVRDGVRAALEPRIAEQRARWLVDQSIGANDRPGPLPAWLTEVRERGLADVEIVDDATPGCFFLPAPQDKQGTSAAWLASARAVFAQRVDRPEWRRARAARAAASSKSLNSRRSPRSSTSSTTASGPTSAR
jgi:hypothetical protein